MADKNTTYGGMGFTGLLTIALVCFKILGYIDWSWWLVFAPIYLPFLIVLAFCGFVVLILIALDK